MKVGIIVEKIMGIFSPGFPLKPVKTILQGQGKKWF